MTAIRKGKDVYCGCTEKGYNSLKLIVWAVLVALAYGIIMFILASISPSKFMLWLALRHGSVALVQAEVVTSRTEAATSTFDSNEAMK